MFGKAILHITLFLLTVNIFAQPINLPLHHAYQRNVDQYYIQDVFNKNLQFSDTTANIVANGHRSMRPMLKENILNPKRGFDTLHRKTTFGDKLFNEHLFIIDQPGFYCTIDPAMRFEGGKDLAMSYDQDTAYGRMFWNTRGIDINGSIGNKLAFGSVFYENQARLPLYQANYVSSRGEIFLNNNGTYRVENGVIPGMGRTKPFKDTGYDFAFASGYVSFTPFRQLNIQMGHGQHFIGNGYRSLFLSDNSFNYPYLKFTSRLWEDKIQYTNVYAGLLNLYRLPEYSTSEATYEKKSGVFHYLSFNLHPKIQFGIFEGFVWERYDSAQLQSFDARMLNPVILTNTAFVGIDDVVNNNVIGLNASFIPLNNTEFYSQFVLQDPGSNRWGFQLGAKYFDVFKIRNLFLQMEYNKVTPRTYAAINDRRSYSHFNLPLAHPAGSGFDEVAVIFSYEFKKVYTRWQYHFYSKKQDNDPAYNNGTDVFASTEVPENPNAEKGYINFLVGEIGYRFNKTTRFEFYTSILMREEVYPTSYDKTTYVMLGLRTNLRNQYFDF